ncbi:hypothetical protein BDQ12DRAFT_438504 [Crucibulum laeve]|uniref:Uncharacterized protein n=1 Tax=Crucibulum laeve TaxID=68775 RepID=A0A5C3MC25_9AGAR|nr:hypothetical protein BDQ12DRAFT_438504 [Crucibulum laeve]
MLKRQRAVSPPPSTPSVPLLDSSSMDMLIDRDPKRRRTLPPVLDGPSRGWGRPYTDDSYEEDYEENDSDPIYPDTGDHDAVAALDTVEYKSANNVLRELHTLNQHRLLFASTSNVPPHYLPMKRTSHTYLPPTASSDSDAHLPPTFLKTFLPAISERPRLHSATLSHHNDEPENKNTHGMFVEEGHCVKERYESSNKFLGSLFLSRRRELGSSTDTYDI